MELLLQLLCHRHCGIKISVFLIINNIRWEIVWSAFGRFYNNYSSIIPGLGLKKNRSWSDVYYLNHVESLVIE